MRIIDDTPRYEPSTEHYRAIFFEMLSDGEIDRVCSEIDAEFEKRGAWTCPYRGRGLLIEGPTMIVEAIRSKYQGL